MERSFWRNILEHEGAIPAGHDLETLTQELLSYLGSTDPELRDEFGFSVLANWIFVRQAFTPDRLRDMVRTLEVRSRVGLGASNTDTVFERSFAILMLSVIADLDIKAPFLEPHELERVLSLALESLRLERDLRGFVVGKGWAHANAHTADLLANLARNPKLGVVALERISAGIRAKLEAFEDQVFLQHEPSRLAVAACEVLHRDLIDLADVHLWLDGLMDTFNVRAKTDLESGLVAPRVNLETFLGSLYFQLGAIELQSAGRIRSHIERLLERSGFIIT